MSVWTGNSDAKSAPRRGGLALRFVSALFTLALVASVAALMGFAMFTAGLPREKPDDPPIADGIVALTGGAQRIADAARLLNQGRGQRLLVSGVNPGTGRDDLRRMLGLSNALAACCLDIDYAALNTEGNAIETARWTRANGYRSLIVVTSAYHIPRTMLLLGDQLPGVSLHAYPVVTEAMRLERWWEHPGTVRLLAGEFVKYLYAQVKRAVAPRAPEA
jgi:uncharacterized SAM-binding protein YcdF (DUF218 family)